MTARLMTNEVEKVRRYLHEVVDRVCKEGTLFTFGDARDVEETGVDRDGLVLRRILPSGTFAMRWESSTLPSGDPQTEGD